MANTRTWTHVVSSVQASLKQTEGTKDISFELIFYWTQVIANRIRRRRISGTLGGTYLQTFTNVPVSVVNTSSNPNVVAGRKFIELPSSVYDMSNDRGIDYIQYQMNVNNGFKIIPFQWIPAREANMIHLNPQEKPGSQNPYWYRTGKYIYLLGVDDVTIKSAEMRLYTTLDLRANVLLSDNLDAELDVSDEEIEELIKEVTKMGTFMFSIPDTRTVDGTNESVLNKRNQVPKTPER